MHLYNVTLQKPTAITHALLGNFSGGKQQEILLCRGQSILELVRVDADTGKLQTLVSHNVFGIVRSLSAVKLTGSMKDYIVMGSDSGAIVVMEFHVDGKSFKLLHKETFGKSGSRRLAPGQYLACDPKGRACMIAAVEKQKFVYTLNRDSEGTLTISSPLEAHKSHMITYSLIGVDVGYENPFFAALEHDYFPFDKLKRGEDSDSLPKKCLTFYEYELGLNHVVRKYSDPVDPTANLLIALPSGKDGPGGVLVCSEGRVTWKNQGMQDVAIALPRRVDDKMVESASRRDLIIAYAVHKMKNFFFVLLQTENGDLFRLTCEYDGDVVKELKLRYFDTILPCIGLLVMKSGFLFAASEFGDNYLFQIESLGDEEDEQEWSSRDMAVEETTENGESYTSVIYVRPQPKNLSAIERIDSLAPALQTKVLNITGDEMPQIYSLCGTGSNSAMKILRHGLEVSELVSYPLPGTPTGVWGLKRDRDDPYQSYIVLSFINATLVLSVGETVEEVSDSGFNLEGPTLNCFQIGKQSMVQIHTTGLRHVHSSGKISEWSVPEGTKVLHSSCNNSQICLALSASASADSPVGGEAEMENVQSEIVYFELDEATESLNEYQERRTISAGITCIAVGPIPEGRKKSKFMTIGCADKTIRVISLSAESTLQSLGMQAVNSTPTDLMISEFFDSEKDGLLPTYFLNVGLETGVMVRTVLDSVNGSLSDTRSRYLGSMPVKLFKLVLNDGKDQAVLAVSSKSWLNYVFQRKVQMEPVSYERIDFASAFVSEQVPEGILAIVGNTLRIITLDNIGSVFNTTTIPLSLTPRDFVYEDTLKKFVIIESDYRADTSNNPDAVNGSSIEKDGEDSDDESGNDSIIRYKTETKKEFGKWASCIRLVNPFTRQSEQIIKLDENETATAICKCVFHVNPGEIFYAVATATEMRLAPRSAKESHISIYRLNFRTGKLELYYKSPIETICNALSQFQGRLLAGIDKTLRIYDLGRKKLLRKAETSVFPSFITSFKVQGDRIYVSDICNSIFICRYIFQENVIIMFADDPYPRWTTRFTVLDYNTVCGADKFGNVFIKRLAKEDIDELEDDITGTKMMHDKSYLRGAGKKLQQICEFYVGDYITSIERCTLITGGRQVIMYSTLMGSLSLLIPFPSVEDMELFTTLEMHMRQELPCMSGRDHMAFRGSYFPVKAVVDGDLIELYNSLPWERRQTIAEELERNPNEVSRQIELIKARVS